MLHQPQDLASPVDTQGFLPLFCCIYEEEAKTLYCI